MIASHNLRYKQTSILLVANSGPPVMAQCCLERPDRYDGHLHWVPGRFSPTEEEALY